MVGVPLDPPLVIARRANADVWVAWRACRQALLGMRDRGFRVRILEEDEPLFIAVELEADGAHLLATAELVPEDAGCELELRVTGDAPRTGMAALMGDPKRAVAALEKRLLSLLERELGRRALTDDATGTIARVRAALEDTRESAAHRREKRAEIESAFAAGLIDEAERDRMVARLLAR